MDLFNWEIEGLSTYGNSQTLAYRAYFPHTWPLCNQTVNWKWICLNIWNGSSDVLALCRQTLRFELVLQQLVKTNLNLKEIKTVKGAI